MQSHYNTINFLPNTHHDVIIWKNFPRYWPFVQGIHRSPVNSPHKGQWRRTLMFSLICVWINGWVNNRVARDLRCHCTHYYVIVMLTIGVPYPVLMSEVWGCLLVTSWYDLCSTLSSFAKSNNDWLCHYKTFTLYKEEKSALKTRNTCISDKKYMYFCELVKNNMLQTTKIIQHGTLNILQTILYTNDQNNNLWW